MGYSIEYQGDETDLLMAALERVAGYGGVVAITHRANLAEPHTSGWSTVDYVVRSVRVPGSGAVVVREWDEEAGGPAPDLDDFVIHVGDISELVIY